MNAPSVKRLKSELRLSQNQANLVRGLIKGTTDPETVDAAARWISQCFNRPPDKDLIMRAIDGVIETHGVEAIWLASTGELDPPTWEYCNVGDAYSATIIRRSGNLWKEDHYFIGCWGDIAETHDVR